MLGKRGESIFQCGRQINRQELEEIKETVGLFPGLSRKELAATICEHLGWMTASGGYKIDACIKLLEKLEAKECVKLPGKRQSSGGDRSLESVVLTSRTQPRAEIVGNLSEVTWVGVKVVEGRDLTRLWNEYVCRYHYLGYKKPFGCHLRYFVDSGRGLLGCLMFAGAAKALRARDRWIGWSQRQRLRNLAWVVNNSRFLIFPWVKLKNLGSHILGQVARRVKEDWQERWGYSPVLVETFVDPQRYEGSCYKAANWQYLGMTTGEGLARKGKIYTTTAKKIFVKPLVKDFGALLCSDELEGRVQQ